MKCGFPHQRSNYDKIISRFQEIIAVMAASDKGTCLMKCKLTPQLSSDDWKDFCSRFHFSPADLPYIKRFIPHFSHWWNPVRITPSIRIWMGFSSLIMPMDL